MRSSMWRGFLCNPAPDAVFHAKEAKLQKSEPSGAVPTRFRSIHLN